MASIKWIKSREKYLAQVRRTINGKKHSLSQTFSKKRAAEKWARQVENGLEDGSLIEAAKNQSTYTVSEALERYIAIIPWRFKPTTVKASTNRARNLQRILPFADKYLHEVESHHIQDFVEKRRRGKVGDRPVKDATIRHDCNLLSTLFDIADREWGEPIKQNPVKRSGRPKLPKGRKGRMEPDQVATLLAHAPDYSHNLLRVIIFGIETAMRRSEMCGLTPRDIEFVEPTPLAHLSETKNDHPRVVPLSRRAVAALLTDYPNDPDTPIFGYMPDGLSTAWERLNKEVLPQAWETIGDVNLHDLRHEATSRLVIRNRDLGRVSRMTGHTLEAMQGYLHLLNDELMDLVD